MLLDFRPFLAGLTKPLAAAALLATLVAAPASAAVHALIVGIDNYVGAPKLRGAVNDAQDLVAALKASGGIASITLLTDAEATRQGVFDAWTALVERSAPGDLLYFHFSGHGINEPDIDGDEAADKKDETFLLAGYDENSNPDERLIDDDLRDWFADAGAKGRTMLFVADACHSGSPTRSIAAAETLPMRVARPRTTPERPRPLMQPVAVQGQGEARPYVYSVGATLDNFTIPEIMIDGKPRGALSWAMARAFEGGADLDGDGSLAAHELRAFVKQNVRNVAASKQTPQFEMPNDEFVIMRQIAVEPVPEPDKPAGPNAPQVAEDGLPFTSIFLSPADGPLRDRLMALTGVKLAADGETAQLIYEADRKRLINHVRDEVASDLSPDDLPAAIAAHRALDGIARLALSGTLSVAFEPNDAVQPEGQEMRFTVADPNKPYLTVFDLTAAGSVHYLWPQPGDPDPYPEGQPYKLEAVVTPPFGADNLVVVATDTPPESLRAVLVDVDGRREPGQVFEALKRLLESGPVRIGLQAFFTKRGT